MQKNKILSLAFLLFLQLIASGQSITLTLDSISSNTNCNDIWTEQNLDLSFVIGTSDDCAVGACYFDVEPTALSLSSSMIVMSFRNIDFAAASFTCSYGIRLRLDNVCTVTPTSLASR